MRTVEQQQHLLDIARAYHTYDVSEAIRQSGASEADRETMRRIVNARYNKVGWGMYLETDTAVRDRLMDIIEETAYGKKPAQAERRTMTREEIIAKVEPEIKFQQMQAKEYERQATHGKAAIPTADATRPTRPGHWTPAAGTQPATRAET